jgi:hypothetical protein
MEVTANAIQTVPVNGNVIFTATPVKCPCGLVTNREDSGLLILKGGRRYLVTFGANVSIPTGGTPGPVSLALALNGESIPTSSMIETPAAVEEYHNVCRAMYVSIPEGCCNTLSVKNTSGVPISVQNANLIVERG